MVLFYGSEISHACTVGMDGQIMTYVSNQHRF